MRFYKPSIIATMLFLMIHMNLSAVIQRVAAIQKNPIVCVICDEPIPFYSPNHSQAVHEERSTNAGIKLLESLAQTPMPIDVILQGNTCDTEALLTQIKKVGPCSSKPGFMNSMLIYASEHNMHSGKVRFKYSNPLNGPALNSLQKFLDCIQQEGADLLKPFIHLRGSGRLSSEETPPLEQQWQTRLAQPHDYDTVLSEATIKKLFFKHNGNFAVGIENLQKLYHTATIDQLFNELQNIQQALGQLTNQIDPVKFPSIHLLIANSMVMIAQKVIMARNFFTELTEGNLDRIKNRPLLNIIVYALNNQKFETTFNKLNSWYDELNMSSRCCQTLQNVMQSLQERHRVLFIGSPYQADFLLLMTAILKQYEQQYLPAEDLYPTESNAFDQVQVNKVFRRIRDILLAQPAIKCNTCGKTRWDLMLCSQCKLVHYCSRECQRADWPRHKQECNKVTKK